MNANLLAEAGPAALARFGVVDTWVFDLDNTLYPAGSDLWPKIDARITHYIADLFGIDGLSARALQTYFYERYGTSLKGLMLEHDIPPADFLAFVHDIDRTSLVPNLRLAAAIAALPGRKLILTNGSRAHALATAAGLGLGELFEDVHDIVASQLVPKPLEAAYQAFFTRHDVDPSRAAMFEDIGKNLDVPHRRGMATVLLTPPIERAHHAGNWEVGSAATPAVDFVTGDLEGFLEDVLASLAAGR